MLGVLGYKNPVSWRDLDIGSNTHSTIHLLLTRLFLRILHILHIAASMARGGITKSKLLLMRSNYREANRAKSGLSKFSGTAQGAAERCGSISKNSNSSSSGKIEDASCWVPHPRTGIYFPKGHEWVMEDVPKSAACFSQTCWFRNVDGVEYNPNFDKDV